MSDSTLFNELIAFVRSLLVAAPREHDEFFQLGCGLKSDEARRLTDRYVAACIYLGNDPGFGASRVRLQAQPTEFDAEFAKAGLGTVVRNLGGGTNVKLRIANHLEGKRNAREAIKNLAPSRRSAILMEISKLSSMPEQAFASKFRSAFSATGVRG